MEDVVDLLEPALEVKSVCYLSYALHDPEWAHISRPKLPKTCKMEGLRREVALLLLLDAPTVCGVCQSSASSSLVLSSSGSWRPGLLTGCAERNELHQTSYPRYPQ